MNPSLITDISLRGAAGKEAIQAKQLKHTKETAQDFEAMFVQMSLKEMRPKLEGGIFNHGLAEDVFYQFLDQAIAKEIAQSQNNFGIADAMLEQGF
ncbi:MAG: rod-binding protein [Candidatus Melainabacteria bacterium]|nr:rod-binding protein [Candidatus Melainabacteria bacterium]